MTKYTTAMGLFCAAGLGVSAASAQITLEKVITNSDPVPTLPTLAWRTAAAPFCFSNGATIDQNGNVTFRGLLFTDGVVVGFNNNDLALHGAPGSLQYLARNGSQTPGLPDGVLLSAFQTNLIPVAANGTIWLGGTNTTAPSGFICTGAFGSIGKVARRGDTMPGGDVLVASPANTVSNFNNVNSNGQTDFIGTINDPSVGQIIAFYVGSPGALQLVCKENVAYPSLPIAAGTTHGFFDYNAQTGGLLNLFFNGPGNIVGSGVMHPDNTTSITALNNEVLFTWASGSGEGALNVIAREGDPAPGCGGATYHAQDQGTTGPAMNFRMFKGNFNNQNHLIYGCTLDGATAGVNSAAVWYYDGSSVHLFRRMGDATTAVPGATLAFPAVSNGEVNTMRLNNSDTVVWSTSLTAGVGGVTSANSSVLIRTTLGSSTDTLLARQGSPVTDPATGAVVIPGALYGSEISGLQQNNAGQIIFIVSLTDDGSGTTFSSNDHALMAWDPVAGLKMVYRKGTDISNLVGFQPDTIDLVTAKANAEGGSNELSDNGWFVFGVSTAAAGPANSALLRAKFPAACYANCDGSTTPPVLNVGDFTCFLQKFAAGNPYANCDGSTQPPVLNVGDFTCFLQKYAAGCP
jgi:hypothetical protein